MPPSNEQLRRSIGRRLKQLRTALGHTQAEMANTLGIGTPRYSKYEIGRSEAPYEVLMKLARLANVSLDYLVAGREAHAERRFAARNHMSTLVANLPIAAIVYDRDDRVVEFNHLYQESFFAGNKSFLRAGLAHDEVIRTWAYSAGLTVEQSEQFVADRMGLALDSNSPSVVRAGPHTFEIRATWYGDQQLVLVTKPGDESGADSG
ncbi:MAG: helix-turn-helix domain-containing protein [Gammaproteobacteria bacterium]